MTHLTAHITTGGDTSTPASAVPLRRLREAAATGDSGAWRQFARCKGSDPNVFFPPDEDDAEEAKAICALCPVREACLEYALVAREKLGVWGGTTARERRRILRRRRRSA